MNTPPRQRWLALGVAAAALLIGLAAALHYHRAGLTLSHYDARGHLVVARRILDSLTPGWQQIGAVWLPLPHLLNALPVQVDAWYRSGASAVALSVASYAIAVACVAAIVVRLTSSAAAALAAASVFALNPNVLYLQATPMTEPLLLGLVLYGVLRLAGGTDGWQDRKSATYTGIVLALACMTRYEAWPVASAALALAALGAVRQGASWRASLSAISRIGLVPAAAVLAFFVFSRVVGGAWFASGFFVPENPALGRPAEAIRQILWGVRELSGPMVMGCGFAGLAAGAAVAFRGDRRTATAVPAALAAAAVLPWAAFLQGHPYRIRYMVPLIAAEAVGVGLLAGLLPRWRALAAAALMAAAAFELRPLAADAPVVIEAQWDRPNAVVRQAVTECLSPARNGQAVMASMGSLGHYMQELSQAGFDIRDFLHEGNGDIWLAALEGARPYAGWVLIEEKAEGGDMLAARARENPRFLSGFSRVCEGAGVALYRRDQNLILNVAR